MNFWMNLKVKTKCLFLVAIAVITLIAIVTTGLHKMHVMATDEEELSTAVTHVCLLSEGEIPEV
ncbi:MAG TPA: hypothetical protein DCZ75_15050 [Geobacter sp.]|nr:hypothetical protein [Geobacter sp.]